jgi:hypothetical protein
MAGESLDGHERLMELSSRGKLDTPDHFSYSTTSWHAGSIYSHMDSGGAGSVYLRGCIPSFISLEGVCWSVSSS